MTVQNIHKQVPFISLRKCGLLLSLTGFFELPLGGKKARSSAVLFRGLRQPSLTENANPVPLKITNTLLMGKLRQGVMAVAAGLALAGCSEANAEDNTQAEIQKVAAVVETTKVTRDQCIALATKAEKITCMKILKAQRVAEITELDSGLEKDSETITQNAKDNEQRRTTVEGLTNEVEGLKKVVALQEQPIQ